LAETLIPMFIKENDFSKSTEKSYKIAFKYYLQYLKEKNIIYPKTSDIIAYREYRRSLGFSTQYIYVNISALKGLYRYLRINQKRLGLTEIYAHDIMGTIKNERIKQLVTKSVLTLEQAKQLIQKSMENRKYLWQYRDHAIIYLMITAGLRSIEIIHVKKADLQMKDGQLVLYINRNPQNQNCKYVKISKGVNAALGDYLQMRNDDNPYLFISHKKVSPKHHLSRTFFRYMFRTLLKDCGFGEREFTPHCLRHTTATMNLLRGGSIEQTRQLMRHEDLQSTLAYVNRLKRLNDDTECQIEKYILG